MSSTCWDRTWQALQDESLRRRDVIPQSRGRNVGLLGTSISLLLLVMTLMVPARAAVFPRPDTEKAVGAINGRKYADLTGGSGKGKVQSAAGPRAATSADRAIPQFATETGKADFEAINFPSRIAFESARWQLKSLAADRTGEGGLDGRQVGGILPADAPTGNSPAFVGTGLAVNGNRGAEFSAAAFPDSGSGGSSAAGPGKRITSASSNGLPPVAGGITGGVSSIPSGSELSAIDVAGRSSLGGNVAPGTSSQTVSASISGNGPEALASLLGSATAIMIDTSGLASNSASSPSSSAPSDAADVSSTGSIPPFIFSQPDDPLPDPPSASVPEPGSIVIFSILGLLGMLGSWWKRTAGRGR